MRAAQGATRTSHLKTPARSYGRWWYVKRARIFLGCTPRSTASRSRSTAPKMVSRGRYAFSMTSAIAVLHDFSNGPPSSFSGPFFGSPDKWRQLPIAERIFRTLQVAPVSNRRVNIRSLTFQEFLRAFKKFPTKSLKEGPSPAATAAARGNGLRSYGSSSLPVACIQGVVASGTLLASTCPTNPHSARCSASALALAASAFRSSFFICPGVAGVPVRTGAATPRHTTLACTVCTACERRQ